MHVCGFVATRDCLQIHLHLEYNKPLSTALSRMQKSRRLFTSCIKVRIANPPFPKLYTEPLEYSSAPDQCEASEATTQQAKKTGLGSGAPKRYPKISAAMKHRWSQPGAREKHAAGLRAAWTPEKRAKATDFWKRMTPEKTKIFRRA